MGRLQDELHVKVTELHDLLSHRSTHSVVGQLFTLHFMDEQDRGTIRLSSPSKQISFLLGVLLSSPEPEGPVAFDSGAWERAKALLNEIFSAYVDLYLPPEDREKLTPEWRRIRAVAMRAFLHYFNTGLMASVKQLNQATIDWHRG